MDQINLNKYKTEVVILRKRKRDYQEEKVSRLVVIPLTSGTKFDLCFTSQTMSVPHVFSAEHCQI